MAVTATPLEARAAVEAARATIVAAHAAVGLTWSHNQAAARALRAAEALSRTAVALLISSTPSSAPDPVAPRKRRQRRKPKTAAPKPDEKMPDVIADKASTNVDDVAMDDAHSAAAVVVESKLSLEVEQVVTSRSFEIGDRVLVLEGDGAPPELHGAMCVIHELPDANNSLLKVKVPKDRQKADGLPEVMVVHSNCVMHRPVPSSSASSWSRTTPSRRKQRGGAS